MDKLIIHISGPSGSGKTTLGNKFKEHFGNKIIVKDLDDLIDEFIKDFYGDKKWKYIDENEYQKYIDDYIIKQDVPIIFVGLNDNNNPKVERLVQTKTKQYYNLHSQFNYYIDIDDMVILKQKCLRTFDAIRNDKRAMEDLVNNNERFLEIVLNGIKKDCSAKQTIKMNNKWKKDYKKQGYKLSSRENIFDKVSKILNKF
jgi:deoxyadenosine/deoxycytidine kinase